MQTFGYAALQIIPSMKGATSILDSELNGAAASAGLDAGQTMGRNVGNGLGRTDMGVASQFQATGRSITAIGDKISGVGSTITKSITVPAGGAAAAAGGITAALGWGRLTSLDSAEAQLRGLGYSAEDVGTISGQVANALEGGMMTLGDGASVAAGALASGVSEGAELERYIKLVDAASVGMNKSASETGLIFARVQGSGKLMTQELNMIEESMPGFSNAMAEHLGVGIEEFRNMVTEGKVSSDEFMDVMEDFAGGMATEYSKSWEGMVANTKAYVGQIGESLLGGVFEQSKDSLAEMIEWLSSDSVQAGAAEIGASIGTAFGQALDVIKGVVTWFMELDGSTQKVILSIGGIAVALGPTIMVIGRVVSGIGTLVTVTGTVIGAFSKLAPIFNLASAGFRLVTGAARGLFTALLTNPIGIIITAITALVAALTWFFTSTDEGKAIWADFMVALEPVFDIFSQLGETLMGMAGEILPLLANAVMQIAEAFIPVVEMVMTQLLPAFLDLAMTLIEALVPVIMTLVQTALPPIIAVIQAIIPVVLALVEAFVPLITTILEAVIPIIEQLLQVVVTVFQSIAPIIQSALQIVTGIINTITGIISGDWDKAWNGMKQILQGVWNLIKSVVTGAINVVKSVISAALNIIKSIWTSAWNAVKGAFSSVWNSITSSASSFAGSVKSTFSSVVTFVKSIPTKITNVFSAAGSWLVNAGKSIIDGLVTGIRNSISKVTNAVGDVMSAARDFLPFSPAKRGPFSGHGWTLYSGQSIGNALADGLDDATPAVVKAAEAIAEAASVDVPGPQVGNPDLPDVDAVGNRPHLRAPRMSALPPDGLAASRRDERAIELTQNISTQDPEAAAQRSGRLIMAGLR